ncbi:hypothetical protein ACTHAM_002807 [Cellulomonas soli]|uniref:hypothetical protein n=1 Tax=Cellulomonas soli TaxID=931535 RepID=UPI003F87C9B9
MRLRDRPVQLAVVCVLVLVEALASAGLGAVFLLGLASGDATMPTATVFLAACCLGVAAALAACARGLWRGRRWARSPVMTWQIMLLVLALGWFGVEASWWSAAVVGVAVLVGVGLVLPPVVAATVPEDARRARD